MLFKYKIAYLVYVNGAAHMIGAGAAWAVIAPKVMVLSPETFILGGVVAIGYGLLADADHPQATFARVLGPISAAIVAVVATLAGGHRNGTHTLVAFGLLLFGINLALTVFAGSLWVVFALMLPGFLCTARMILQGMPEMISTSLAFGACFWAVGIVSYDWIIWAAAIGYATHLVLDILTVQGIPLFKPFSSRTIKFPITKSGGFIEKVVTGLALVILLNGMWTTAILPRLQSNHPEYFKPTVVETIEDKPVQTFNARNELLTKDLPVVKTDVKVPKQKVCEAKKKVISPDNEC